MHEASSLAQQLATRKSMAIGWPERIVGPAVIFGHVLSAWFTQMFNQGIRPMFKLPVAAIHAEGPPRGLFWARSLNPSYQLFLSFYLEKRILFLFIVQYINLAKHDLFVTSFQELTNAKQCYFPLLVHTHDYPSLQKKIPMQTCKTIILPLLVVHAPNHPSYTKGKRERSLLNVSAETLAS